jgi:lysophospholipase L1-like esterase
MLPRKVHINSTGKKVSINGSGDRLPIIVPDADAINFINAAGITNDDQKTCIDILFTKWKNDSVYSKILAAYLMVGNTSSLHKWNAVNPVDSNGAYRISFGGSVTHNDGSIKGDGSSGFGDTNFVPSSHWTKNDTAIMIVVLDNTKNSSYVDLGSSSAGSQIVYINSATSSSSLGRMYSTTNGISGQQPNSTGYSGKGIFILTRISSTDVRLYKNGRLLTIGTVDSATDALSTRSITILCQNGTVSNTLFSARTITHILILNGLTDSDVANISIAAETYLKNYGTYSSSALAINRDILALGDSFTAGSLASTQADEFIELLGSHVGQSIENRGQGGEGSYAVTDTFFSSLKISNRSGYWLWAMFGFNDLRRGGSNPKTLNKIQAATRTLIVTQFAKNIASVQDSSVTKSNWSTNQTTFETSRYLYSTTPLHPLTADAINATLQWTFTGTNCVIGAYITATATFDNLNGPFEVRIDGVLQGSAYDLRDMSDGIASNANSNDTIPYAIRISGLTNASHVLEIKCTTSTPSTIDYVGILFEPSDCPSGIIFGDIPFMTAAGYATAPANATTPIMQSGTDAIKSVTAEYISDGYPIGHSPTNDFYNLTTDVAGDNVHPNDSGHQHIYESIISLL